MFILYIATLPNSLIIIIFYSQCLEFYMNRIISPTRKFIFTPLIFMWTVSHLILQVAKAKVNNTGDSGHSCFFLMEWRWLQCFFICSDVGCVFVLYDTLTIQFLFLFNWSCGRNSCWIVIKDLFSIIHSDLLRHFVFHLLTFIQNNKNLFINDICL